MAVKTEKAVIYHVPKCGGHWVKAAARRAGLTLYRVEYGRGRHPLNLREGSHTTPYTVSEEAVKGKFSVVFVRRPETWYQSFWAFRKARGWLNDDCAADWCWSDDFNTFVNNLLDEYPHGFVTLLYQFFVGPEGDKIDFVGRQENLADDLVTGLTLAGDEFDHELMRGTPRRYVTSPQVKAKAVYTDAMLERVMRREKWVLETFYA